MPFLTVVTLPVDATAQLLGQTGELFTDLFPIIALAIGVPLAFFIIRRAIALVPKGR